MDGNNRTVVINAHYHSFTLDYQAQVFSCVNGSCQGSPPYCYCDANCQLFEDCCSDAPYDCEEQGTLIIIMILWLHPIGFHFQVSQNIS